MATGSADELRLAVRRLHAAGIEVILDVVYNHTAEGSEMGQTLSLRGLDHATYYRLQDENPRYCVNDTGTGNSLNMSKARVVQMVADSLRYWAESFRIDGFRFDLGVTLGREGNKGFDPGAGFFDVLRQDPVLQRVKLISEPWDIGPGGYQLGHHPPGFAEWNDQYRDTVRRYWRRDPDTRPALASRLSGSGDIFDRRARRSWASVNFLAAHDGMTLADLVSYEGKHNEANGEDNRDGHSENLSRNWGAEGPSDNPEITTYRERLKRSMLVTLFGSLGTPMLLAGDEFGRTQNGNNNAYCQDNPISWLNWEQAGSEAGRAMIAFTARAIGVRSRMPPIRAGRFLYGEEVREGILDLDWFDERSLRLSEDDWRNIEGRALVMRLARLDDEDVLQTVSLMINSSHEDLFFKFPDPPLKRIILMDSAEPEICDLDVEGDGYLVKSGAAVWMAGRTRFRLWAPGVQSLSLELETGEMFDMAPADEGWFEAKADVGPGCAYRFKLPDGRTVPDPASRRQKSDVHGWSLVVEPSAYSWENAWKGRPWTEAVIYEAHCGVLGGYSGLSGRLADLAKLGFTAIELMPLAAVSGTRNWGYDGVLPYAASNAYGSLEELKDLIDKAHGLGLMVLLDVVYNHFGPDGNYLPIYAPDFFHHERNTPWGGAIAFDREPVARFFIDNARYWIEEFRFDGLRLDAVHAIADNGFLDRLACELRQAVPDRQLHLILENETNDPDRLERGYDAQWNDDFHNVLHVLLTGETHGYYAAFADKPEERLARCLSEGFIYQGEAMHGGRARGAPSAHLPPTAFVAFLQNHDQVGNRALGERLTRLVAPDRLMATT
ncbi:hypothetical protein LTR94_025036, partial [Friedmanniomyces endolithicus]